MNKQKQRRPDIRGILFDKDGTLIDFDSIWIPLALELVNMILDNDIPQKRPQHQKLLLQSIGIGPDNKTLPHSVYASGTMEDVANTLFFAAIKSDIMLPYYSHFLELVQDKTKNYIFAHRRSIKAISGIERTLAFLKQLGLILGISTSDSEENTQICLMETGLIEYFDYIGCPGNSKQPKPSGDILLEFSGKFDLNPEEIAVVGDSAVDIAFARQNHAGLAIGVLSGAEGGGAFTSKADYVLPTVVEIIRDNQPIWIQCAE
ncbi:phosphoglycolate phosphatase [Sporobacter termitidis DSM 10068]|uniref:Phosphoglycolate phosphatase n=1 Tax=Sporobacter termitidis DSM 10068 TaxID=1123282 RepID=A0A1M5ZDK2_9FIRM|nr:HAD family hydrolase [Sporobacter termitidis]SHI22278.1 phosphoglycolate phosphatase [Sporobacter termitidis DSM 10068]